MSLGATALTIQTDGEPAIVEFGQTLTVKLRISARHRVSPVGSHASNGGAEMAVQRIAAQTRALRLRINMRYDGYDFRADHRLTAWAIRHAAWLETRFQPKSDGHSAFYRARGVEYKSAVY